MSEENFKINECGEITVLKKNKEDKKKNLLAEKLKAGEKVSLKEIIESNKNNDDVEETDMKTVLENKKNQLNKTKLNNLVFQKIAEFKKQNE